MRIRILAAAFIGLVAFTLSWAGPAKAAWRRAESPNFILYGNLTEGELRRRILRLEEFDRLLRVMTGVTEPPAPNRLPIYIVATPRELTTIRDLPPNTAGFYSAEPSGIAAFIDNSAEVSGNEILFHEYAHHFMSQYRPSAYPAWYVEGFAEYFMTARFDSRGVDTGLSAPGRAYLTVQGRWLPMEQFLHGSPHSMGRADAEQFYAQSWITTHYFFSTPERQAALNRYLTAVRGGNSRGALLASTGMDEAAFAVELRRYVHGRITYGRLTLAQPATPPRVTVVTLPPGADDLMIYWATLSIGMSEEQARTYLPRIRAAAARNEGDPFALRVLAQAELLFGDREEADRILDRLLASSPNDAELLYLKGMRYLAAAEHEADWQADARTARQWLGRAHRADANHFQTLVLYSQSLRRDPDYRSENNLNVMMLAHRLAPQVPELTMNAAALLIDRREYALAMSLLRPLAADPHRTRLARAAQELIDQAQTAAASPAAIGRGNPSPQQQPN